MVWRALIEWPLSGPISEASHNHPHQEPAHVAVAVCVQMNAQKLNEHSRCEYDKEVQLVFRRHPGIRQRECCIQRDKTRLKRIPRQRLKIWRNIPRRNTDTPITTNHYAVVLQALQRFAAIMASIIRSLRRGQILEHLAVHRPRVVDGSIRANGARSKLD